MKAGKKILIGFEESGTITTAFREAGYTAFSCDLQPTRGNERWHYQADIFSVLHLDWDLIILHPDCTCMAVSGNRWYGQGMQYYYKRLQAIEWTKRLWNYACDRSRFVALENPVSVIFQHLTKSSVFYIQPYQFGHGEQKKTGFATKNLPPLVPTNEVEGREQKVWKMPPSETRKRDRSKTYSGIAAAIVEQWGPLI